MKFAVDSMLGKLARWLRILGYDVVYDPSLPIGKLIERANREERIVITRRKTFPDDVSPTTMFNVECDLFPEQLYRTVSQLGGYTHEPLHTVRRMQRTCSAHRQGQRSRTRARTHMA